MSDDEFMNENEFNEENSKIKNSSNIINNNNNNKNSINNNNDFDNFNEINKNNNQEFDLNKDIGCVNDEKALLKEIDNLEQEKKQWYKKRKEQNDTLEKYMNLLKNLQIKNEVELKDIAIEETELDFGELMKYNTMLNNIESEERILEEEEMYFEKYKNNFNRFYEDKQKEIEDMKLNYEKEKEEIDKKLEILEAEEKMINDKYNNFEYEKKIITERYNNAIKKEASLLNSKMKIEEAIQELDRRNLIFEKNNQLINETKNEMNYQILKNLNEEKKILDEKNDIKLRQDMIDSLRMKYVGEMTSSPIELMSKTYNNNGVTQRINYDNNIIKEYNNNFPSTINQNEFNFNKNIYEEKYNNFTNNKNYEIFIENNNINKKEQGKLSIIEENEKFSKDNGSIKDNE